MDWFRQISHPIIQNPSNRSLAAGHARGEDVDAFVLAQVKYIISDKHIKQLVLIPYSYFLLTYAIFSL